MNLPFFKRFNKKILPLYYLVLTLRDEKAQAVIFKELEGRIKIIGQREEYFSTTIDNVAPEEFLEVLDRAISRAESSLPENIQTEKTIFGVKNSWTDNDQIKKEYLAKLKKASEELGLIPIGFLVISQAIAHLMQKEEGAPVSAILAEINKKSVTVTLLRAGKTVEAKSSEIHESIPFTVDTLLKHFDVPEILPSRIIIFNGKEDLSQEFISHTWSKSLPFLHLPQITNLPHGFDVKSILFEAATQMGLEVMEKDIPQESNITRDPFEEEIPTINDEENPIKYPEVHKNLDAEDFGFAKDIDVAKMPSLTDIKIKKHEEHQESFENPPDGEEEKNEESIPQFNSEDVQRPVNSPRGFNNVLELLKKFSINVLGFIFVNLRRINVKKISSLTSKGKFVIAAPIILIVVIIACYFLFMKTEITLTVDPKIIEQNKSVLFSTIQNTDPSQNIVRGEFVSISEDGSVSTPATGKKDVGTPAKGSVTIFNSLTESKTLPEGTILQSPSGLEFSLDSSVTINAVASHSADETVTPQTVSINVTANQLGKESNLPSGTKFSVNGYDTSDLIAKNDNPFSGGTKTQVTVASKTDQTKLENDLLKQLETNATTDLQKQLNQSKILLPAFTSETLAKETLSTKIGYQTNQLTLTGTVDYQTLSYNKSDLIEISKSLLSQDIPSNQTIDYNNIKTSVVNIKDKNDEEINATFNIKALLLPKISESEIIKSLKGKSFKDAQDLLYKLPQVANVSVKLSPNIPFLPKNLPAIEKNIKILIKING